MGTIKNILFNRENTAALARHGTNYTIETPTGIIYQIVNDSQMADVTWQKSVDYGLTWSNPVTLSAIFCANLAVWADWWSGAGTLIHIAYIDDNVGDVFYNNLDTASDTLSSRYTVFAGASSSASSTLSITRTRGGNLICGGCIDAGAEPFCYKSTDVGVNWTSIAAVSEATLDQLILLPGWAADTNDAMCFFYDDSATEISRKLYDDSANSWSEDSIATSIILPSPAGSYPNFNAAVDTANSQNILVAWSAVDTANADLRCWKVTEGAITEVTNVVLNSTDDQGCCAISINVNTNNWYVFYGGKSDGSETWNTAVNIYMKVSTDFGATWGSEIKLTNSTMYLRNLFSPMRFYGNIMCRILHQSITNTINIFSDYHISYFAFPSATYQLGM